MGTVSQNKVMLNVGLGISIALFCAIALLCTVSSKGVGVRAAEAPAGVALPAGGVDLDAVLRFDPDTEDWEVFSIPTANARPWGIDVVLGAADTRVWFTESGADRIGCLIYTATAETAFHSYALEQGSEPLNLTLADDGRVWFTEAGRNRVGRLDPETGAIAEFDLPTADSRPADLDLAADGSVWLTEMNADQVAHLVVTSTVDYDVVEYGGQSLDGGRPYGIVVVGSSVYLAQTARDRVTRFTPPNSWAQIVGFVPGVPDEPFALTVDPKGDVWGVERAGNRVSVYAGGTFPIVTPFNLAPAGSLPAGIAVGLDGKLWATQWAAGQIASVAPSPSPSVPTQYSYYALPVDGLAPTGIAVDDQGIVWIVAMRPMGVYLPLAANAMDGL